MANQYGYFVVEALVAFTPAQAAALLSDLCLIGQEDTGPTHRRLIHQERLDANAAIYRGVFNENQLTHAAIRNRVATILGVPPGQVTTTTGTEIYNGRTIDTALYANNGNQYARVRFLGLIPANVTDTINGLANARNAGHGYLKANSATWENNVLLATAESQPKGNGK